MPVPPKEGVDSEFTEATDRSRHLTLERLAAHLAVGHDFQAGRFLEGDRLIHRPVLDFYEFFLTEISGSQLLLRFKQVRGAEQTPHHIRVEGNHGSSSMSKAAGFKPSVFVKAESENFYSAGA